MPQKQFVSSYIAGTGRAAPEKIIPNSYFVDELHLDTSDEWITERTGIKERRWTEHNVGVSVLAEQAAMRAMQKSGLGISEIDGIIFGTITPDHQTPASACLLQAKLGMTRGFAFDISAACSGFVYSLVMADSLIASGRAKNLLVVGADIVTSLVDMQDRNTCVLFGDAAGAAVVRACEPKSGQTGQSCNSAGQIAHSTGQLSNSAGQIGHAPGHFIEADFKTDSGIYYCELHSDGSAGGILKSPLGTACRITPGAVASGEHFLKMDGKHVFKFAVSALVDVTRSICAKEGVDISDIDHFITHQANIRILQAVGEQLGLSESKIPSNIAKYGNTSAATVPVLLDEEIEAGRVKKGDLVLLTSIGAGMAWGGALVRL